MTIRALQIFKAGTWQSMQGPATIDEHAVDQVVRNYSCAIRPAPLVLGHPDVEKDTYGEVLGLTSMNGALYAFADVGNALIDAVRAGRYKNVSASIYWPLTKGNPTPGSYYLRHVGFLGAVAPAVKGMQPLNFASPLMDRHGAIVDFSVPAGWSVDHSALGIYTLARDLQHADPSIGLAQAATLAQSALNRGHHP